MSALSLPPIVRSISVSWDPPTAFRRFTADFGTWWPAQTHSIGGEQLTQVVFETKVGGRIYEEHTTGRRFQWGVVLEWDPPRRVKFTWHPSRDPASAQEVEVLFHAEGSGTRVELTSDKWERWGPKAKGARRGYDVGWGYVLNVWAGRRTTGMIVLDGIMGIMKFVQKFRGGTNAVIAKSGGEIPPA